MYFLRSSRLGVILSLCSCSLKVNLFKRACIYTMRKEESLAERASRSINRCVLSSIGKNSGSGSFGGAFGAAPPLGSWGTLVSAAAAAVSVVRPAAPSIYLYRSNKSVADQ